MISIMFFRFLLPIFVLIFNRSFKIEKIYSNIALNDIIPILAIF
jgi:hypothetical protein